MRSSSASAAVSPLARSSSAKRGGKRGLGDDLRLDAGRKSFGPGLAVAFHGGQALFFPDQRVDVAEALFHARIPPFQAVNRADSDQLDLSL